MIVSNVIDVNSWLIQQFMLKEQTIVLPIYFQAIRSLQEAEEDTLQLIFSRLSQAWPSSIIEEDQFQQNGAILEERLQTCQSRLLAKTHHYLLRHKRELLRTYLLLKVHIEDQPLDATTLPSAANAIVTSQFRNYFEQPQITAFLYLVCSIFMPMFIRLMQASPQPLELMLTHSESLCYSLTFAQMDSLYVNEGLFLKMMLERPLRILSNFPTLHDYDLYSRINFSDLLEDSSCLVSSCLVDQQIITLVQTFNFSKIILFSDVIAGRRPLTNNALLNTIERLDIHKIFSQPPNRHQGGDELSSKSLCLTVPTTKRVMGKMRHFFECLPPQLAPLSKYDALSFGSGEESNMLLFRLATEEYWERCPQSQFLEVYYLCNDSFVDWISLPSEEYRRSGKIRFWSEAEIRSICSPRYQASRGVQRKGELVVVGQGHEHFWRVRKGYGMGVLVKWSILLKSRSQLSRHMELVRGKEGGQLGSSWLLQIPHRSILLSFLAHQHCNLDGPIKKGLVVFIMERVAQQEKHLVKLCRSYQQRLTLKKSTIPTKFRLCGICGHEIMSICCRVSSNILCLQCLSDQISEAENGRKFQISYICKPSAFTNYFRNLLSSPSEPGQLPSSSAQKHAFYQQTFCQGTFLGSMEWKCMGHPKASELFLQNHIRNIYSSLQIHIFVRRSYFCTIEGGFKCFCLKKCQNEEERVQMGMLLGYLSRSFLNREQRHRIRDCICRYYHEQNYVADGVRIMAEGGLVA